MELFLNTFYVVGGVLCAIAIGIAVLAILIGILGKIFGDSSVSPLETPSTFIPVETMMTIDLENNIRMDDVIYMGMLRMDDLEMHWDSSLAALMVFKDQQNQTHLVSASKIIRMITEVDLETDDTTHQQSSSSSESDRSGSHE